MAWGAGSEASGLPLWAFGELNGPGEARTVPKATINIGAV